MEVVSEEMQVLFLKLLQEQMDERSADRDFFDMERQAYSEVLDELQLEYKEYPNAEALEQLQQATDRNQELAVKLAQLENDILLNKSELDRFRELHAIGEAMNDTLINENSSLKEKNSELEMEIQNLKENGIAGLKEQLENSEFELEEEKLLTETLTKEKELLSTILTEKDLAHEKTNQISKENDMNSTYWQGIAREAQALQSETLIQIESMEKKAHLVEQRLASQEELSKELLASKNQLERELNEMKAQEYKNQELEEKLVYQRRYFLQKETEFKMAPRSHLCDVTNTYK